MHGEERALIVRGVQQACHQSLGDHRDSSPCLKHSWTRPVLSAAEITGVSAGVGDAEAGLLAGREGVREGGASQEADKGE